MIDLKYTDIDAQIAMLEKEEMRLRVKLIETSKAWNQALYELNEAKAERAMLHILKEKADENV